MLLAVGGTLSEAVVFMRLFVAPVQCANPSSNGELNDSSCLTRRWPENGRHGRHGAAASQRRSKALLYGAGDRIEVCRYGIQLFVAYVLAPERGACQLAETELSSSETSLMGSCISEMSQSS